MDITHDNVCSSMLSCFYSHLLSTGRPISSYNYIQIIATFSSYKLSVHKSLKVLQIANFSQITHSPTFGRAFTL